MNLQPKILKRKRVVLKCNESILAYICKNKTLTKKS